MKDEWIVERERESAAASPLPLKHHEGKVIVDVCLAGMGR